MHAAPARYASVSELYSTDEVELLLDEIRELEPTSCRGEDVQDFEIAGSGSGGGVATADNGSGGCGGLGRSPTDLTDHSWDSHPQYSRAPPPAPKAIAPLYCAVRAAGIKGLALLVLSALGLSSVSCVWAAVGRAVLPLQGRVQLLQLAALTTAMAHGSLLALRVTRLADILPLHWDGLTLLLAGWSCTSLAAGGVGTLLAVHVATEYRWAPPHVAALLTIAAALGLLGSLVSGALLVSGWRAHARDVTARAYRSVPPPPPLVEHADSRDHAL